MNIRTIFKNIAYCKKDILEYKPDAVVLIDYPGFNLKIAEFAKTSGFKVYYYIAPKVWASRKSRVKKLNQYVDILFSILPFELDFLREHNCSVTYVGNPLVDAIESYKTNSKDKEAVLQDLNLEGDKPIIALLAGSRRQEISLLLPEMLEVLKHYPDYQFVVAGAPAAPVDLYEKLLENTPVKLVLNKTYQLLSVAHAAFVTSGTATLETALFNVPQVVMYKFNSLTYHIGKHFVNIEFFSLVNLIMQKEVVKELLQFNLQEDMKIEMDNILFNEEYRDNMLNQYKILKEKLGEPGASERAAKAIVEDLNK
jgi:lipid-A-disaccharide synthase